MLDQKEGSQEKGVVMGETIDSQDTSLHLVTFKLNKEEYGIDILKVHEIIRMMQITQVPNAPNHVYGVINLRGKVIPVISLKKYLSFDASNNDDDHARIMVVELDQKVVGFIVDAVSEVIKISEDVVEPPSSIASDTDTNILTGVAKLDDRMVMSLDFKQLLSREDNFVLKNA